MGYPPGKIEELVIQSLHKFSAAGEAPSVVQEVEVVDLSDSVCTNLEKLKINDDFEPADYYNGAKFEQYCWSQTLSDIREQRMPFLAYKFVDASFTFFRDPR
jgi:hypothetical protein